MFGWMIDPVTLKCYFYAPGGFLWEFVFVVLSGVSLGWSAGIGAQLVPDTG